MKKVDINSIEIDGVDTKDYPDFADSFASYAEWSDGDKLTDNELDDFNDEFSDIVQGLALGAFQ